MKYHNLKVRKVRRTLGPNLEPPEPFDCPQKPNLEPTEPPKMAEPRTSNQVRSKSSWLGNSFLRKNVFTYLAARNT